MGVKRTSAKRDSGSETRGPVLDVLKTLLQSGRSEEVVTLVEKLVARNSELELSPPTREGTTFTGITGDQEPTWWHGDRAPRCPVARDRP